METRDTATRERKEQLYPPLSIPNWLVLRGRREIFEKWLPQLDSWQSLPASLRQRYARGRK